MLFSSYKKRRNFISAVYRPLYLFYFNQIGVAALPEGIAGGDHDSVARMRELSALRVGNGIIKDYFRGGVFLADDGFHAPRKGKLAPYLFVCRHRKDCLLYTSLGEQLSVFKVIGMVVLIAALFLSVAPDKSVRGERPKAVFYILCFAVFCLNGGVSILSKVHQINAQAIATKDYMIWLYMMQLAISLLCFGGYLLFFRRKTQPVAENIKEESAASKNNTKKIVLLALLICLGYMLFSGFGYLLQLNAAKNIAASLLYPFITGGSIVFSTLAAWAVFKEKINLFTWISLGLTLAGTIVFVF